MFPIAPRPFANIKCRSKKAEKTNQAVLKALILKLRYLLTTCPQTLSAHPSVVDGQEQTQPYKCRFCSTLTSLPCQHCLKDIILEASKAHQQIAADATLVKAIPLLDKDPRLDLSLVIGMSLLKIAGLPSQTSDVAPPPLSTVDTKLFLQAVLLLDTQLKETPKDNGLRVILVRLYLLLGCASYALQLWAPLEIKRTIQDSLSPLFFDRISTLSPGLFQGIRPLMEPLRSYYNHSLRDSCPVRIWDAFSSGSYNSIVSLADYDNKLRKSCTLMMTLVEERHATRAFGGKLDADIDELALTGKPCFRIPPT